MLRATEATRQNQLQVYDLFLNAIFFDQSEFHYELHSGSATIVSGAFKKHKAFHKDLHILDILAHNFHAIAIQVMEFPQCNVLSDEISESLSPESNTDETVSALKKEAIKLFPEKGFPIDFHTMNEQQKNFLNQHGPVKTLFLLGEIETAYALPKSAKDDAIETAILKSVSEKKSDVITVRHTGPENLRFIEAKKTAAYHKVRFMDPEGVFSTSSNEGDAIKKAMTNLSGHDHESHSLLTEGPSSYPVVPAAIGIGATAILFGVLCCRKRCSRKRQDLSTDKAK